MITAAPAFPEPFKFALEGIASVAFENGQLAERVRRETLARTNLARYFTPSVAERIVDSEDAVRPGGDKRPVAVLFSDIRGFTTISEQMNPFQMAKLLSDYFSDMVDCVFRHGGTLDKFMGDALMAQWGAPFGQPDDVDRALRAALDMLEALDKLNSKWAIEGRPTMQAGIGLNFGEVFAGNIGSERRLEYTVIGDTVNTASRLCSAAAPGEILITEHFQQALASAPRTASVPELILKGKAHSVQVYRVLR
ncbi:MAG TPA: adenylate/guanylate cyclase domain-containing protein [Gemmatimonadaceae bacterium]|jgi:adenylate cyclase